MGDARPKLGVLLPTRGLLFGAASRQEAPGASGLFRLARQAEDAGLDSVWVGDSLTAKPRLEPLAILAAVAAQTRRVRLGTAVLLMALRHPVLLAQTLATVDLISQGRLVVAAGVGGAFNDAQQQEWRNAGVAPSQRARRLEEMVPVVKGLGSGQPFSFHGRHFDLDGVVMEPRPVQPGGVPILLACHGRARQEAQYRRAARLADGIISISDTPAEYGEMVHRVRALAAELGRDPARLEAAMYLTVNVEQDTRRAGAEAESYLMSYYGANIWGARWGPFGDPARVRDRLAEYAAAGAQTIIVRFAAPDPHRQLELFLEHVAPDFLS